VSVFLLAVMVEVAE